MTPSAFFRLVAWFTAFMAVFMGTMGVVSVLSRNILPGLLLLAVAAVNVFGYVLFSGWSRRNR